MVNRRVSRQKWFCINIYKVHILKIVLLYTFQTLIRRQNSQPHKMCTQAVMFKGVEEKRG